MSEASDSKNKAMMEFRGFPDFATASQEVLKLLSDRIGFDLWMVTRVKGDDWIVLQAEDRGYGVKPGQVFAWRDSYCAEMVKGNGPFIAPNSVTVKPYRSAPINQQVNIGAYIGMPLCDKDGNLFGTLCGIHPTAFPSSLEEEMPLIRLMTKLLSSLLDTELQMQQEQRRAQRAEIEAQTDALTGLYNRRGWDELLAAEEIRCQHFGYSACIIVIDLDDLKVINDTLGHAVGDSYLCQLGDVIRKVSRKEDIAARTGGDEFAILGIEIDEQGLEVLRARLQIALAATKIKASLGVAMRDPGQGLMATWREADAKMYRNKHSKRVVA